MTPELNGVRVFSPAGEPIGHIRHPELRADKIRRPHTLRKDQIGFVSQNLGFVVPSAPPSFCPSKVVTCNAICVQCQEARSGPWRRLRGSIRKRIGTRASLWLLLSVLAQSVEQRMGARGLRWAGAAASEL